MARRIDPDVDTVDLTPFVARVVRLNLGDRVIEVSDDLDVATESDLTQFGVEITTAEAAGESLDQFEDRLFLMVARLTGLSEKEVRRYGRVCAWQVITYFFGRVAGHRRAQANFQQRFASLSDTGEPLDSATSLEAAG